VSRISGVEWIIFRLFLCSVFFVYYETRFLPGTLHTWLMLLGLAMAAPRILTKVISLRGALPVDYVLVIILGMVVCVGYGVNISTATWSNFQAYMLMLATYVYTKESMDCPSFFFLNKLVKCFLVVNSLLLILQTITGAYYPAKYIGTSASPLEIASGLSDGPTKNGFLIAFCLSMLYAQMIFRALRVTWLDAGIFLLGLVSLVLAASRAGLLSFGVVVVVGVFLGVIASIFRKDFHVRLSGLLVVGVGLLAFFWVIVNFEAGFGRLYELRGAELDSYGLNVVVYKASTFMDDSTHERFENIAFFLKTLLSSPLHVLTVGFGPGSFETLNGLNIHNSWLELLFSMGIYGYAAFLLLLGYVLVLALRRPDAIAVVPVVMGLLSIMVFMVAHDVVRGRIFWVAFGIISAFSLMPPYGADKQPN
jgi:hypothetical protein